jgi:hypothetical protein
VYVTHADIFLVSTVPACACSIIAVIYYVLDAVRLLNYEEGSKHVISEMCVPQFGYGTDRERFHLAAHRMN